MSNQPTVATISDYDGESVTLNGWLYNIRGSAMSLVLHCLQLYHIPSNTFEQNLR